MAPVAVGDIIRVTARMQIQNLDDLVNVFHYKVVTNSTLSDDAFMIEVAADLDASYQIINPEISSLVTYVDIDGQNVTQNELLPAKPWPVLVNGADIGALLPQQVAACVFYRTLTPKIRASKFLGGYTENSNNAVGAIDAAAITNLTTYGVDALVGINQPNVVATYGAYNKPLDRFTPVVQSVVPAVWRTQRRRRPGVGS